jgi:hypothetical protein
MCPSGPSKLNPPVRQMDVTLSSGITTGLKSLTDTSTERRNANDEKYTVAICTMDDQKMGL